MDLQIAGGEGVRDGLDGNSLADSAEPLPCLGEAEPRGGVGAGDLVRDGEDDQPGVTA
ncbi:hypothetical protein ACIQ6R_17990 [Streptomyces sp. NPDC096048]|uniref:hypothetical protein n=1 Tax=Streptomyces sp. NPDC096048 TaxID=3366072 RepID=UPI00380DC3F7